MEVNYNNNYFEEISRLIQSGPMSSEDWLTTIPLYEKAIKEREQELKQIKWTTLSPEEAKPLIGELNRLKSNLNLFKAAARYRAKTGGTQPHNPTAKKVYKPRDKSKKIIRSPFFIFTKVRTQLFKQGEMEIDSMGFYLPRDKQIEYKLGHFQRENGNERTVAVEKIKKAVDLERYRFNYIVDAAYTKPNEIAVVPDLIRLLINRYNFTYDTAEELIKDTKWTNRQIRKLIYWIDDDHCWNYEMWRDHYRRVPYGFLTDPANKDFTFHYLYKPGSFEFHPEFAYKAEEVTAEEQRQKEEALEKKRWEFQRNKNWGSK